MWAGSHDVVVLEEVGELSPTFGLSIAKASGKSTQNCQKPALIPKSGPNLSNKYY